MLICESWTRNSTTLRDLNCRLKAARRVGPLQAYWTRLPVGVTVEAFDEAVIINFDRAFPCYGSGWGKTDYKSIQRNGVV